MTNYEQNIERIQTILDLLEAGNLPLNESIALYEEAMELYKECREYIEKAEMEITKITNNKSNTENS